MSKNVKMKHASACSFSHDGVEVVADKKGVFDMPAELVGAALEHGFEHASSKGGSKADDQPDQPDQGDQPDQPAGDAPEAPAAK